MTNRENFEQYLQGQVDYLKGLTDKEFASCTDLHCHEELWAFASIRGKHWKYVKFGYPMPPGQHEEIVKWLREEAKNE